MSKDLGQAYDDGAKLQNQLPPQGPTMRDLARSATAAAAGSDLDRWRSRGTTLLRELQRRLSDAKATYAKGKAEILADAERARDELAMTYGDKLREFDRKQQDILDGIQAEISELLDYREIGRWPT